MNHLHIHALTIEEEGWVHHRNRDLLHDQQKLHCQRMKELVKGTRYEDTRGCFDSEGMLAYAPELHSTNILDEKGNVHTMEVCVITQQEWQMLEMYLREQRLYEQLRGWSPAIYRCQRQQKDEVRLPVCHTPDWLSAVTYTADHLYHTDADATGTMLGINAYNVYVFEIEQTNDYGLVTHSYFPSV